jgi:hypothetical protein
MLLSRDPTASVLPSGEYLMQLIHFLDSNSESGYDDDSDGGYDDDDNDDDDSYGYVNE